MRGRHARGRACAPAPDDDVAWVGGGWAPAEPRAEDVERRAESRGHGAVVHVYVSGVPRGPGCGGAGPPAEMRSRIRRTGSQICKECCVWLRCCELDAGSFVSSTCQ
eukprot:scaffold7798_cov126-Isochrysis_galbana.AAC.4